MKINKVISKIHSVFRVLVLKVIYRNNLDINIKSYIGKNFILDINTSNSKLKINKIYFRDNIKINLTNGVLNIGEDVFINSYTSINCRKYIEIGNNTIIGEGVRFYDHDHKYKKGFLFKDEGFDEEKIVIGSNVWIGSNVIILKGSIIGDDCIIAAGSIVKGKVPSGRLYKNKIIKEIKEI